MFGLTPIEPYSIAVLNDLGSGGKEYSFTDGESRKKFKELKSHLHIQYLPILANAFHNPILQKNFSEYGEFLTLDSIPFGFKANCEFNVVGNDNVVFVVKEGTTALPDFSIDTLNKVEEYLKQEG